MHVKEFLRRYFLKILPRFCGQFFCGTPPNGYFCVQVLSSVKDLVIFSERFVLSDINSHTSFNNLLVNSLETQEIKQKWVNLTSNNTLIRSGYQTVPFKLHYNFFLFFLQITYIFKHLSTFSSKLDIYNCNTGKTSNDNIAIKKNTNL